MLCQILQTDDVQAVQQWLGAAGDNGKIIHTFLLFNINILVNNILTKVMEDFKTFCTLQL